MTRQEADPNTAKAKAIAEAAEQIADPDVDDSGADARETVD